MDASGGVERDGGSVGGGAKVTEPDDLGGVGREACDVGVGAAAAFGFAGGRREFLHVAAERGDGGRGGAADEDVAGGIDGGAGEAAGFPREAGDGLEGLEVAGGADEEGGGVVVIPSERVEFGFALFVQFRLALFVFLRRGRGCGDGGVAAEDGFLHAEVEDGAEGNAREDDGAVGLEAAAGEPFRAASAEEAGGEHARGLGGLREFFREFIEARGRGQRAGGEEHGEHRATEGDLKCAGRGKCCRNHSFKTNGTNWRGVLIVGRGAVVNSGVLARAPRGGGDQSRRVTCRRIQFGRRPRSSTATTRVSSGVSR